MFKLFRVKGAAENIGTYMLALDIVKMARPMPARVLIHIIAKMVENSDMTDDDLGMLRLRLDFIRSRRSDKSVQ